jgi:hypothetical protein
MLRNIVLNNKKLIGGVILILFFLIILDRFMFVRVDFVISDLPSNLNPYSEIIKDGRVVSTSDEIKFKKRLRVGEYTIKVLGSSNQEDGDHSSELISSKKNFGVGFNKRSVNVKMETHKKSVTEITLPFHPKPVSINKGLISLTNQTGSIYIDNVESLSVSDPVAYSYDTFSVCIMDNGSVLTADRFGRFWIFNKLNSKMVSIDVKNLTFGLDGIDIKNNMYVKVATQNDSNFICGKDRVLVNGLFFIDKDGKTFKASKNLHSIDFSKLGSGIFIDSTFVAYSKFNADSFGHDEGPENGEGVLKSKIVITDVSGGVVETINMNGPYSNISTLNIDGNVFYCGIKYTSINLGCFNKSDNSKPVVNAILSGNVASSVSNLHILDKNTIIYTADNSVWAYNIDTGSSSAIFNVNGDLLSDSLSIDASNRKRFSITTKHRGAINDYYKIVNFDME